MTDADSVAARVRELIRALAPADVSSVGPDDLLQEDLLFDSLTLLELAVRLEREFELTSFQEEPADLSIETVGEVERLVQELLAARP